MPPDLKDLFDRVWDRLEAALDDSDDPFRFAGLASAREDGLPTARMVVIRRIERSRHLLRIYTDQRSGKCADILREPRVSLLFWDPGRQHQVRIEATAGIEQDAAIIEAAWQALPDHGRKAYHLLHKPGMPMPNAEAARAAARPRDGEGRGQFLILNFMVDGIDSLILNRNGHERAAFRRVDSHWTGQWIAP